MKKLRSINFFAFIAAFLVASIGYAKADAILITSKGDKGTGHTSVISQDKAGNWHYFFWGINIAYEATVPLKKVENIDRFNQWLYEWKDPIKGATQIYRTRDGAMTGFKPSKTQTYYTRGTYIKGDFSETTEYYTEQINSFSKLRYYAGLNFCSVVSRQALEKGKLIDGTLFKDLTETYKNVCDRIPFYLDFPVNYHNLVDRSVKGTVYEGNPEWGDIHNPDVKRFMLNGGTGSSS